MIIYSNKTGARYKIAPGIDTNTENGFDLVQIEEDRYTSHYSGHLYTAWIDRRPDDISGGDIECRDFWERWKQDALYGVGSTPQDAFRDLIQKAEKASIDLVDEEDPEFSQLLYVSLHCVASRVVPMVYNSDQFREWLNQ